MNTKLIQLRQITAAPLTVCKSSLEESNGDLDKAVDLIKIKGQNIILGEMISSEGKIIIRGTDRISVMIEINTATDFAANSSDFTNFSNDTAQILFDKVEKNETFDPAQVEDARKALVATTKENIVVRRWWAEQAVSPMARVFVYLHSNCKIGVILTLLAPSEEARNSKDFYDLGENLAMQVAAMNPLAIDVERLSGDEVARQKAIFEQQLTDLKKPQTAWPKILEGKFRKWHSEVCLMEQESVWVPKTSVKQVVANVGTVLGGEIKVVTMLRCQVGEGVEVKKDNLADEVNKLIVDQAYGPDKRK